MDFTGQVVVITGAGAGIGQEAALAFSRLGAKLLVNSRTEKNTDKTVKAIRQQQGEAIGVPGDASDEEVARTIIDTALSAYGRVDVLVNNAGIVCGGAVCSTLPEDWDETMRVNVRSVYLLSRQAVEPMKKQGGGVIINISSVVAVKGVKDRAAYSASKGAILALSRAMAADYISDGIRVNCVSPGTTDTPSLRERIATAQDPEQAFQDFVARQPMGRLGTESEIVAAILFAAWNENSFMSGANLIADGGMTCSG